MLYMISLSGSKVVVYGVGKSINESDLAIQISQWEVVL